MKSKLIFIVLLVLISFNSFNSLASNSKTDLQSTLRNAVYFFDANKCGKEAAKDNVFEWRSACHTTDGNDVSIDLTGGFHNEGDNVKDGFSIGYSSSILGWSLYEFKTSFDSITCNKENNINLTNKTLSTLKYFTDYFLKSHPSSDVFYYNIANPTLDHMTWTSPELQNIKRETLNCANSLPEVANPYLNVNAQNYSDRPALALGDTLPAANILGMTSASLSLMYLNYKDVDLEYSKKCLTAAIELYNLAKVKTSTYNNLAYYPKDQSSFDQLSWASFWLYKSTNNIEYFNASINYYKSYFENKDLSSNLYPQSINCTNLINAISVLLAPYNESAKTQALSQMEYWLNLPTINGNIKKLENNWFNFPTICGEVLLAMTLQKTYPDIRYKDFALSQIEYLTGENPDKQSYIVSTGIKYPSKIHHRAADCNPNIPATNKTSSGFQLNELRGALVNGPLIQNNTFNYTDDNIDYMTNSVGISNNSNLVGAIAGVVEYANISNQNAPLVPLVDFYGIVENAKLDSTIFSKIDNNFTIEGWIRPKISNFSNNSTILNLGCKNEKGIQIVQHTSNSISFILMNGSKISKIDYLIKDKNQFHFSYVKNDSNITLYINYDYYKSDQFSEKIAFDNTNSLICINTETQFELKNLKIYNTALDFRYIKTNMFNEPIQFTGEDIGVILSSDLYKQMTRDFSIEMWINPSENPSNEYTNIIDFNHRQNTGIVIQKQLDSTTKYSFCVGNKITGSSITIDLKPNQMQHLVLTRKSNVLSAFIDSKLESTTNSCFAGNIEFLDGSLTTIGFNKNNPHRGFRGIIEGLKFYDYAIDLKNLSPDQNIRNYSLNNTFNCISNKYSNIELDNISGEYLVNMILYKRNFTVSFWVKPNKTQLRYANILDLNHRNNSSLVIQQDGDNTNTFGFGVGSYGLKYTLSPDIWQHVSFMKKNKEIQLYINGVLVGRKQTASNSTFDFNNSSVLAIGHNYVYKDFDQRYFNGIIRNIRFFKYGLSDDEIKLDMNKF